MSKSTFFPTETWDNNWMIGIFFEEGYFLEEAALYFTSSYNNAPQRKQKFSLMSFL